MIDRRMRPPFDPEVEPALAQIEAELPVIAPDIIPALRAGFTTPDVDGVLAERSVTRRDVTVPGYRADGITLSVLSRNGRSGMRPYIFHLHAGAV